MGTNENWPWTIIVEARQINAKELIFSFLSKKAARTSVINLALVPTAFINSVSGKWQAPATKHACPILQAVHS